MNGIIRLGTSETQFVDTNKMVVVRTGFEPVSFKLSNPRPLKSVIASTIPPPDYLKKPHEQILRYAGGDIIFISKQ